MKYAECHPTKKLHARGLCSACYRRNYFQKNPDRYNKKLLDSARWRLENKDHLKSYNKKRNTIRYANTEFKEYVYRNSIRYRYGVSSSQYDDLLKRQGGKCAICGKPPKERRLAIDHNHKTGKVRGILCNGCNSNIGWLESKKDIIQRYLR